MTYDFETFCKHLDTLKNARESVDKLYELGVDITSSNLLSLHDALINSMTYALEDEDGWIEYYVYECNFGNLNMEVTINGKPVKFESYRDLWDIIHMK